MMKVITINTSNIKDKESFHKEFKEKLNFMDGYGMNMDAWIDSMSEAVLDANGNLCVLIQDSEEFLAEMPELFNRLINCSSFVNKRLNQMKAEYSLLLKFM